MDVATVLFVVDSLDRQRFEEARGELVGALTEAGLSHCRIVVAANKQDVRGALRGSQIGMVLRLNEIDCADWRVFETSAGSGCGVTELLDACTGVDQLEVAKRGSVFGLPSRMMVRSASRPGSRLRSLSRSLSKSDLRWGLQLANNASLLV